MSTASRMAMPAIAAETHSATRPASATLATCAAIPWREALSTTQVWRLSFSIGVSSTSGILESLIPARRAAISPAGREARANWRQSSSRRAIGSALAPREASARSSARPAAKSSRAFVTRPA